MRIKEKLLIIFLSIVMSFAGFNLIASSYAGLLNGTNDACYETINSYLTKGKVNSLTSPNHDDRALQSTPFNPDCSHSK